MIHEAQVLVIYKIGSLSVVFHFWTDLGDSELIPTQPGVGVRDRCIRKGRRHLVALNALNESRKQEPAA